MPPELADYIIKYGYVTIFSLVFLQEIGVPNPVTNELVLLFSGYLTFTGQLSLFWVIVTVVLADVTGTSLLYVVFYKLGEWLMAKKPKWLPVGKIESLKRRVEERELWGVFAGRLLPYLRGYTSVAAGLLKIKPRTYLTAVVLSAVLWSGGYVLLGHLLGRQWDKIISKIGFTDLAVGSAALLFLLIYVLPKLIGKVREYKNHS